MSNIKNIKRIRTSNGDLPIDYESLDNLPIFKTINGETIIGEGDISIDISNDALKDYMLKEEAFSGSYNDLTDKPAIPSIDGLATESYVDDKVNNAVYDASAEVIDGQIDKKIEEIVEPDQDNLTTKEYVDMLKRKLAFANLQVTNINCTLLNIHTYNNDNNCCICGKHIHSRVKFNVCDSGKPDDVIITRSMDTETECSCGDHYTYSEHTHEYDEHDRCTICNLLNPEHIHNFIDGVCLKCGVSSNHKHTYSIHYYNYSRCLECGEEHRHTFIFNPANEEVPCEICGITHQHVYESYDPGYCDICHYIPHISYKEHEFIDGVCSLCKVPEDFSCKIGFEDYRHEYNTDDHHCRLCGEIEPGYEHEYDEETQRCKICNLINPDHIHEYDDTFRCIYCGVMDDNHVHDFSILKEDGKYYCICGDVYIKNDY